jgi:two-component system chemotaxis sensor kinase CheA
MILVVASHPETRDALVPLVARKGYPVDAVDCGDEMLARLRFRLPALVILDCDLPDSFDMLGDIRSQPHSTALPVVMFSAPDERIRQRAIAAGADAYVGKGSLDWAELLQAITDLVGPPSDQMPRSSQGDRS